MRSELRGSPMARHLLRTLRSLLRTRNTDSGIDDDGASTESLDRIVAYLLWVKFYPFGT